MQKNKSQWRSGLKSFNMACLEGIREVMRKLYCGKGPNENFWNELECVLKCNPKNREWKRMEGENILGEVWIQDIGAFYHKHTVHRFSYLYVQSQGLAVAEHGHEELFHDGKQVKKLSEWYIFPDGRIEFCRRGETHKLVNNYTEPIYVLSIKVGSNAIS